jgi:exodeoxyribonuclease VII small subunit
MPRAKTTKEPTFEQAFEELREVVQQLEAGDLPLERSLALFERGQALAGRCAELLDTAELRVKTLAGEDLTIGENEEEER